MGHASQVKYDWDMDDDERLTKISNLMDKLGLAQTHLDQWLDEKAKAGVPPNNDEQESLNGIKTKMQDLLAALSKMIDDYTTDS